MPARTIPGGLAPRHFAMPFLNVAGLSNSTLLKVGTMVGTGVTTSGNICPSMRAHLLATVSPFRADPPVRWQQWC